MTLYKSDYYYYSVSSSCCVSVECRLTQEELDAISMNPTRITTDLEWAESHVRKVCGGQLPPLVGPYSIPFLLSELEGMRKQYGYTN